MRTCLVANRGEIAWRIVRALHDMGIASVAVFADDDATAPHVTAATRAVPLGATGPPAYLDGARLVSIARENGCDALHPGYGFLSERADFARACAAANVRFIGPTPDQLGVLGDKAAARALAVTCGVPLLPATARDVGLDEAQAFLAANRDVGVMVKAALGGGGRGMRAAHTAEGLEDAWTRCRSEALAAFGAEGVYVERLMAGARHIEIQVLGDGSRVVSLGDRDCTIQRKFQKIVEIAPSPSLPHDLRRALTSAALRMANQVKYEGLGTFEFLVDARSRDLPFVFLEANPRLQVEHTITEEVTGLDLVHLQIRVAEGKTLDDLGLDRDMPPSPRGFAVQWRINAETLDASGNARPGHGTLTRFDLPSGPGIRVDTHGAVGASPSPHYDSLLAKLVVSHKSADFGDVLRRAERALGECVLEGIATNLGLLRAVAARPEVADQAVTTTWFETVLPELLTAAHAREIGRDKQVAGGAHEKATPAARAPEGSVCAPMPARLVSIAVAVGDVVPRGAELAVLEAMKMELVLEAPVAGRVVSLAAAQGSYLAEGQPVLLLEPVGVGVAVTAADAVVDLATIRPDLQRVRDRHAFTHDRMRPAAVAKRHAQGGRTARENIEDLCDEGSFLEYGALAIAAQTRRRTVEDLIANTPADGMVSGIGTINAEAFGAEGSRAVVIAYDYTVLAGTQGMRNHEKAERMLELAHRLRLPLVLFAEGGGGRPGDTDMPIVAGLNNHTFSQFAALSGKVPVVGIVHGRCFAGNAALVGCADVIIATERSNIGMSGPAMIEGGGLGVFKPEEIGPSDVQARNGVIDVLVRDEAEAVGVAKRYLSYFQGPFTTWQSADPRALRHVVPENRLRVYEIRRAIRGVVDDGSFLELRATFGAGIVTGLARIEGRAVGVIANNPYHLGGAIDVEAADKASRFMQLCDAHGLPILSFTDTPGFMVGPAIEAEAQVRHACRMFVVAAHLSVPFFAIVVRKGYGLGAQAMTAGGLDAPVFTIAWPTGEFGSMGLEGAVRLGFRKELEAASAGDERDALFKKLVAQQYANGEAMNMAATLEIDAVIDPAETRDWLVRGLASVKNQPRTVTRFVDPW